MGAFAYYFYFGGIGLLGNVGNGVKLIHFTITVGLSALLYFFILDLLGLKEVKDIKKIVAIKVFKKKIA